MASSKDTLFRQWTMLRMIPRHPRQITARELCDRLIAEQFDTTKRTVERDLQELSSVFSIACNSRSRPYGWCWHKDSPVFNLPGMSPTEALTFKLAEQHLRPILPTSALEQLAPYFAMASRKLDEDVLPAPVAGWLDKVRVLQPSQTLLPPQIEPEAQRVAYNALLTDRQLKVAYLKKGQTNPVAYDVNLLGIVQRGQIIYQIAWQCSIHMARSAIGWR